MTPKSQHLPAIRSCILRLPLVNFFALKHLIGYLNRIVLVKTTSKDEISELFGPIIFHKENPSQTEIHEAFPIQKELFDLFLDQFRYLFKEENFQSKKQIYQDLDHKGTILEALYDYVAQGPRQLSFTRGDLIVVLKCDPSGWWAGKIGNTCGLFPSNYTRIVSTHSQPTELKSCLVPAQTTIEKAKKANKQLISQLNSFKQKKGEPAKDALERTIETMISQIKDLKLQIATQIGERLRLERIISKIITEDDQ
eukprot:Anaeramoba_ignava/c21385_g1_i2.p1 GENE.c21385_g1_i2~~c21385_g1_i2.p1  ORF type:complete len:253 (+),score=80.25 c21385_g1_i2:728-1486(+)